MSLRDQLIKHEDLRLKPYRCTSGKLTIGVGRNLDDVGITEAEAMMLLDNDIANCRREAVKLEWFPRLDPVRQDAILNMIFNMGLPRLLGFKGMIAAIKDMDWERAKVEALDSVWAKQVGRRAEEVAEQLRTGISR